MKFTDKEIRLETDRLYNSLKNVKWSKDDCELIAPLTLEINKLKKEKNAVILAHSYTTPDIIFGVSDFSGDSLALSKKAASTNAEIIIFAGVLFMAETAKILSPEKTVLIPDREAGCSLADSITAEDVRELKSKYPGIPVVAYVNTSAEVKAEVDICVTSANVIKIINSLDSDKIIFLPDKNMANYIRSETNKTIIDWEGVCVVHNEFTSDTIIESRKMFQDLVVIAHSECPPDVLSEVDMVGGTSDMQRYIMEHPDKKNLFLVTECGLSDRFSVEFPDRNFYGTCSLCPYMKMNSLKNILEVLKDPKPEQHVELDPSLIERAKNSINEMLKY